MAIQYLMRNPEQERVKNVAKQRLEVLWHNLGRSGPVPEFNEYELLVLKDIVLPREITTSINDIGGLDNIKATLWETVLLPFLQPEIFESEDSGFDGHNLLSAPLGVLFYGPPGTGKTMMAKAIAKSTNAVFIPIDFSTMYNKYLGESEKIVRALFSLAHKLSPSIVFIDEIDVFLRKRGNSNEHEVSSMMKGQFMTLWDGLASNSKSQVMVMGATNRPYDLDEAILRRLPRQLLFGLPKTDEREAILRVLLSKSTIHENDKSLLYSWVARRTSDYSGSDLKELCKFAAMQPMREFARSYRTSVVNWGNPQGGNPKNADTATYQNKGGEGHEDAITQSDEENPLTGIMSHDQYMKLKQKATAKMSNRNTTETTQLQQHSNSNVNGFYMEKPKPRPISINDFRVALENVKPTGREAMDHLQRFYASQMMKSPFMNTNTTGTSNTSVGSKTVKSKSIPKKNITKHAQNTQTTKNTQKNTKNTANTANTANISSNTANNDNDNDNDNENIDNILLQTFDPTEFSNVGELASNLMNVDAIDSLIQQLQLVKQKLVKQRKNTSSSVTAEYYSDDETSIDNSIDAEAEAEAEEMDIEDGLDLDMDLPY